MATTSIYAGGIGPNDSQSAYHVQLVAQNGVDDADAADAQALIAQRLADLKARYPAPEYQIETVNMNKFLGFVFTHPAKTISDDSAEVGETAGDAEAATAVKALLGESIFPTLLPIFVIVDSVHQAIVDYADVMDEMTGISAVLKRGYTFKVDVGRVGSDYIGPVWVNSKSWIHILVESRHLEVTPDMLMFALARLAKHDEDDPKIELWRDLSFYRWSNLTPAQAADPLQSRPEENRLLVAKYRNNIFQIIIQKRRLPRLGDVQFVRTAYGSGRFGGATAWPSLVKQWSNVTRNVAKFTMNDKLGNPRSKLWSGTDNIPPGPDPRHPKPGYIFWQLGEIPSDGVKSYTVDRVDRRANVRTDRTILP